MFLKRIVKNTREEVKKRKEEVSLKELTKQLRPLDEIQDFKRSLLEEELGLIAEIKKASPSKGLIRENFNPVEIAKVYTQQNVAAISVLTDERFFQGSLEYLRSVREVTDLPLLRKEFIIDPYQIYEAQAYGADAVLLIVNILSKGELVELLALTKELGLDALVEVHTTEELGVAQDAGAEIIGVNNRDLKTFNTDLKQTLKLKTFLPKDKIIVSESGISTRKDIEILTKAGVDGVLIGEAIMRSNNLEGKINELMGMSSEWDD
ncbi:MAG: indole-3-glycerol phosphate synthase [Candidatus Frackibacter sp. T328-2]|nr:MAG: indole-3-glycerol phosphate synthase [Candidatus Frackibacter sp. T328-2]